MIGRVLVVDDEPALLDAVGYALRSEGFDVATAEDGEAALGLLSADGFDVVVLDIMLPRLSGIEICRRLRGESDVPIILLSARDAEVDRVLGLESGADDYVTKPFSMAELLSRVRAVLRRRDLDLRAGGGSVRRIGRLEIDPVRHTVRVDGEPVRLTPSEFKLLALLAREPERVFTRREIMQHLWDSTYVGDQRACDIHVSNLRRKLERDPDEPEQLVTVRGVGYKLVAV
jgi:two-component system response regulator RegX3